VLGEGYQFPFLARKQTQDGINPLFPGGVIVFGRLHRAGVESAYVVMSAQGKYPP
jgi:hypothetical protein